MRDIHCLLAAALFVLANLLGVIFSVAQVAERASRYGEYVQLDHNALLEEWEFRFRWGNTQLWYGILQAAAWLVFTVPLLKFLFLQSRSGQRQIGLHYMIFVLAMAGSIVEFMSSLLWIGTRGAMSWILRDFELSRWVQDATQDDGLGYKVVELIYTSTAGLLLWIDLIEAVILATIFLLVFFSVHFNPDTGFSQHWSKASIVLAFLLVLDFATSVASFQYWTWQFLSLLVTILNRIVFVPLWLVWMGNQLPKARAMVSIGGADGKVGVHGEAEVVWTVFS